MNGLIIIFFSGMVGQQLIIDHGITGIDGDLKFGLGLHDVCLFDAHLLNPDVGVVGVHMEGLLMEGVHGLEHYHLGLLFELLRIELRVASLSWPCWPRQSPLAMIPRSPWPFLHGPSLRRPAVSPPKIVQTLIYRCYRQLCLFFELLLCQRVGFRLFKTGFVDVLYLLSQEAVGTHYFGGTPAVPVVHSHVQRVKKGLVRIGSRGVVRAVRARL